MPVKHGHNPRSGKTATYNAWANMLQRCSTPTHPSYPDYGGRGITVCNRWRSYEAFLADVGERPAPHLMLERVDNKRGYEPGNVVWATRTEQNRNRRSVKMTPDLILEVHGRCEHGESQKSVAARLGLDKSTVSNIRAGKRWQGSVEWR